MLKICIMFFTGKTPANPENLMHEKNLLLDKGVGS